MEKQVNKNNHVENEPFISGNISFNLETQEGQAAMHGYLHLADIIRALDDIHDKCRKIIKYGSGTELTFDKKINEYKTKSLSTTDMLEFSDEVLLRFVESIYTIVSDINFLLGDG